MRRCRRNLTAGLAAAVLCGCGGGGNAGSVGAAQPAMPTVPTIVTQVVFTSLSFAYPTVLRQAPADNSRWFVGEKNGVIRVFSNNPNASSASVFLDISGIVETAGEGGLLGFAFHPNYPLTPEVLLESGLSIVGFSQDVSGEVYVLDYGEVGTIHKLELAP